MDGHHHPLYISTPGYLKNRVLCSYDVVSLKMLHPLIYLCSISIDAFIECEGTSLQIYALTPRHFKKRFLWHSYDVATLKTLHPLICRIYVKGAIGPCSRTLKARAYLIRCSFCQSSKCIRLLVLFNLTLFRVVLSSLIPQHKMVT